jgi:hypothetical protein
MRMEDDKYVKVTKCPLPEEMWKDVKCRYIKWHQNVSCKNEIRVKNGCWHEVTDEWEFETWIDDVYPCKGCGRLMYREGYCGHCINASW